jgi:hypothetical protein
MSRWFADAPAPRLSQISLQRLHRRVDAVMDEGLLWTARVLSGMAAAVLIVGSIWLVHASSAPRSTVVQISSTPPWAGIPASTSDAELTSLSASTPAAQWYLTESSSRAEELP